MSMHHQAKVSTSILIYKYQGAPKWPKTRAFWCVENSSWQYIVTLGPICLAFLCQTPHTTGALTPILLGCPHVTSCLLPCLKNTLKGEWFEDVEMINLTYHSNFQTSPKQSMRGASSSRRATGISVSMHKRHSLRGISSSSQSVYYCCCTASVWICSDQASYSYF